MYRQPNTAVPGPSGLQNFAGGASPMGFRRVTSPHPNLQPNQVQQYQYDPYSASMNANTVYTNPNYVMQPRFNNAMPTSVQPTERRDTDNVFNFNNRANRNTFENNFALPQNIQTSNFGTVRQVNSPAQSNVLVPKAYDKNFKIIQKSDNQSVKTEIKTYELARPITKSDENEKIRIFTGTAEKIIKWHKIYKDYFCFYEVIASIVSIQEGMVRLQKIMLLRDKKGPIIQIIHYVNDHIKIENFFVGQMLRCVGRMVGPNIMHGLSIREATDDEVATLQRMCYISDHAISKALKKF